jgi:hypothetical protein
MKFPNIKGSCCCMESRGVQSSPQQGISSQHRQGQGTNTQGDHRCAPGLPTTCLSASFGVVHTCCRSDGAPEKIGRAPGVPTFGVNLTTTGNGESKQDGQLARPNHLSS